MVGIVDADSEGLLDGFLVGAVVVGNLLGAISSDTAVGFNDDLGMAGTTDEEGLLLGHAVRALVFEVVPDICFGCVLVGVSLGGVAMGIFVLTKEAVLVLSILFVLYVYS